jgi:hypothetical protein
MSHEVEILLVEDSPEDAELTIRTLRRNKLANDVQIAEDGAEALDFLLLPRFAPESVIFPSPETRAARSETSQSRWPGSAAGNPGRCENQGNPSCDSHFFQRTKGSGQGL